MLDVKTVKCCFYFFLTGALSREIFPLVIRCCAWFYTVSPKKLSPFLLLWYLCQISSDFAIFFWQKHTITSSHPHASASDSTFDATVNDNIDLDLRLLALYKYLIDIGIDIWQGIWNEHKCIGNHISFHVFVLYRVKSSDAFYGRL